ncbi:MAG TPA: lamin tail domain-containing protein [Thermomicrobiales bacterium]|nr:lamin tail domain-containing protein [Thermomicrobiales bacterium]
MRRASGLIVVCMLLAGLAASVPARAEPVEHRAFARVWERVDMPVATLQTTRTWMWGPSANTLLLVEPYREAPGGARLVQYFDKSRMEITRPDGDRDSIWYVTNGLLATELITGHMQVGDDAYELFAPAEVNVAGDPDDPDSPTYASLAGLLSRAPATQRRPITEAIDRDGAVTEQPQLAQWGARDEQWVPETGHWVAGPFWELMQATGIVYEDGVYFPEPLFPSEFYATGYPITDAYWTRVPVGGTDRDVLAQCFQRRCLTWTPLNPPAWQVEAGNIGQHYYAWRYGQPERQPSVHAPLTGDARVTFILYDPNQDPASDHEYVDITNFDNVAIPLAGWRIQDNAGITYTFPAFRLQPGATVRLHVAHGIDTATDLYWGRGGAIWNNTGDTAYLYDATGALVHTYAY